MPDGALVKMEEEEAAELPRRAPVSARERSAQRYERERLGLRRYSGVVADPTITVRVFEGLGLLSNDQARALLNKGMGAKAFAEAFTPALQRFVDSLGALRIEWANSPLLPALPQVFAPSDTDEARVIRCAACFQETYVKQYPAQSPRVAARLMERELVRLATMHRADSKRSYEGLARVLTYAPDKRWRAPEIEKCLAADLKNISLAKVGR